MKITKINEIIKAKINKGEIVTAEQLINKIAAQNEELKIYWQQKYKEISGIAIKEVE
jgi:hypothetical protein